MALQIMFPRILVLLQRQRCYEKLALWSTSYCTIDMVLHQQLFQETYFSAVGWIFAGSRWIAHFQEND